MIEMPGLLVLDEMVEDLGGDVDEIEDSESELYLVDRVRTAIRVGERNVRVSHIIKQGEGWTQTAGNMDDEDVVMVWE